VIAGVAGGLGEYFKIDPVIIRLLLVVLGFAGGNGVLLYVIAWVLIPERPLVTMQEPDLFSTSDVPFDEEDLSRTAESFGPGENPAVANGDNHRRLLGGVLLIAGLIMLVEKAGLWLDLAWLLPIGLIVVGFFVLVKGWR
jgi:phage shock protein PspC (stress-responsive transcriptional regulator)